MKIETKNKSLLDAIFNKLLNEKIEIEKKENCFFQLSSQAGIF